MKRAWKKGKYAIAGGLVWIVDQFRARPMTQLEKVQSLEHVKGMCVLYSYGFTQKDIGKFLTDVVLYDGKGQIPRTTRESLQ